jgi:dCMP deaminase
MKLIEVEAASTDQIVKFYKEQKKSQQHEDILDWHQYFLNIAEQVALRSKDAQTKVGAVLVDRNHYIISTGYNSFPRGLPDQYLPNLRPDKYIWIKHAEKNCILNCQRRPKSGAILYLTGFPCFQCLTDLWSFNISKIIYNDFSANGNNGDGGSMLSSVSKDPNSLLFLKMTGMKIFKFERD